MFHVILSPCAFLGLSFALQSHDQFPGLSLAFPPRATIGTRQEIQCLPYAGFQDHIAKITQPPQQNYKLIYQILYNLIKRVLPSVFIKGLA